MRPMIWTIRHERENRYGGSFYTFEDARAAYFRQWRDPDGSIPWVVEQREWR